MKTSTIYFLFICLFFIYGCQRQEVIKTHGISYLEKREKLIVINKSNKNDAIQVLGQPATRGMTNDNLWIYIERTKSKGKIYKLGRDVLLTNNLLVVKFDKYGVLEEKLFYNKDNMKHYKFAKNETANDIKRGTFLDSFLQSLRQKMRSNAPKN